MPTAGRWRLARFFERMRNGLGATSDQRVYRVAVFVTLILGIWLRSNRYWVDPIGLWGDEAIWASRMLEWPLQRIHYRPLGYMAVTRAVVENFGVYEQSLRLLSYLGGLGSLVIAAFLARRLMTSRLASFALVFLFAVHPGAVDFAKEFKPYALEICIHLALIALYIKHRSAARPRRWLYLLLLTCPLAFWFAYNAVLAYPALFLILGIDALREHRRRDLLPITLSALACFASIIAAYLIVLQTRNAAGEEKAWGRKYGVFYTAKEERSRVAWHVTRHGELAAMPGVLRPDWRLEHRPPKEYRDELDDADSYVWIILHVMGLVMLARWRRWKHFALLAGPLIVGTALNVAGRWPWGAFRVNLFLLAYFIPLACIGMDALLRNRRHRWNVPAVLVGAFVVLPYFAFGFNWHNEKRAWVGHVEMQRMLAIMAATRTAQLAEQPDAPRERIHLDNYTCAVWKFYQKRHTGVKARYGAFFKENFRAGCRGGGMERALLTGSAPSWGIVTDHRRIPRTLRKVRRRAAAILIEERLSYSDLLLRVQPRQRARKPKPTSRKPPKR